MGKFCTYCCYMQWQEWKEHIKAKKGIMHLAHNSELDLLAIMSLLLLLVFVAPVNLTFLHGCLCDPWYPPSIARPFDPFPITLITFTTLPGFWYLLSAYSLASSYGSPHLSAVSPNTSSAKSSQLAVCCLSGRYTCTKCPTDAPKVNLTVRLKTVRLLAASLSSGIRIRPSPFLLSYWFHSNF